MDFWRREALRTQIDITSGESLNAILTGLYPERTFIPFNEAMLRGTYTAPLFSDAFCAERAACHGVSEEIYRGKLAGFFEILKDVDRYDTIVLWFGAEPFCTANTKTVLETLRMKGFSGKTVLNIVNEDTGAILRREEPTA